MNQIRIWVSQLVYCRTYPPYSLTEVNEEMHNHEHKDKEEEVQLVEDFNEPIPTREYP